MKPKQTNFPSLLIYLSIYLTHTHTHTLVLWNTDLDSTILKDQLTWNKKSALFTFLQS